MKTQRHLGLGLAALMLLGAGAYTAHGGPFDTPEPLPQGLRLEAKVYLQGPYDKFSHEMGTLLNDGGYLPTTAPFGDHRVVGLIPDDVVDWVFIQLRELYNEPAVAERSAFLRKDGILVDDDGSVGITMEGYSVEGDYYILIRHSNHDGGEDEHRNHLDIMSSVTHHLGTGSSTQYDFTTGQDRAWCPDPFPDPFVELEPGIYGMIGGDAAHFFGSISAADRGWVWNDLFKVGYLRADVDLSGSVGAADRGIPWNNRYRVSYVPPTGPTPTPTPTPTPDFLPTLIPLPMITDHTPTPTPPPA